MELKQYGYIIIWDCGGTELFGNTHQAKVNGQIGIMYLLSHLGPPPEGSTLEVIESFYPGPTPVVALGFYDEPGGARAYAHTAEIALEIFNSAVDWQKIATVPLKQEIDGSREARAKMPNDSLFPHFADFAEPTLTDILPAPNREA